MKDRFDLEDSIMSCWEIVDELELISKQQDLDIKAYQQLVEALRVLYSLKFANLFSTFEKYISNKQIH
jgi:hypothetical protein